MFVPSADPRTRRAFARANCLRGQTLRRAIARILGRVA